MADLRNKIFGLASAALFCTGMAYGQANCSGGGATSSSQTNLIRAEGTTELVGQITFTCVSATPIASAGNATVQVFISPNLPVTSKVLNSAGATEAVIQVGVGGTPTFGTVSGSTVSFSGVPLAAGVTSYTFVISNIRVNASTLTVGTGAPPPITATAFVSGSAPNVVPSAVAALTVGYGQNGLGTTKLYKAYTGTLPFVAVSGSSSNAGPNNFVICNAYSPAAGNGVVAIVQVNENFASAFKDIASAAPGNENSTVPIAAGVASSSATGNAVAAGTRIAVNFANVPNNVTLYVPVGIISSQNGPSAGGASIRLTTAGAGSADNGPIPGTVDSKNLGAAGTGLGVSGLVAPVSISGGAGSATFQVLTSDVSYLDSYNIPVYMVSTANSVAGSSTAMTISTSFSPIGSSTIPNFVQGSSTTSLTGSKFSLCTTSLLWPFVTNQLGFDTGLAISNTSTDPFGTAGATPQAGTCTLNFYGNGAPTPNNVTTQNIPSGTTASVVMSQVAAGFQGYIIAQCQFQFAHGFAFITNLQAVNGGQGGQTSYLAAVIPDTNQHARGADPVGVAGAGTGETLGQ
jgi:hypothetical protein